jgi:hypothetical protein
VRRASLGACSRRRRFARGPEELREAASGGRRDCENGVGSCRRASTPDPRDAKADRVSIRVSRGTGDPMPGVSPPALAPGPRTRGTLSLAEGVRSGGKGDSRWRPFGRVARDVARAQCLMAPRKKSVPCSARGCPRHPKAFPVIPSEVRDLGRGPGGPVVPRGFGGSIPQVRQFSPAVREAICAARRPPSREEL